MWLRPLVTSQPMRRRETKAKVFWEAYISPTQFLQHPRIVTPYFFELKKCRESWWQRKCHTLHFAFVIRVRKPGLIYSEESRNKCIWILIMLAEQARLFIKPICLSSVKQRSIHHSYGHFYRRSNWWTVSRRFLHSQRLSEARNGAYVIATNSPTLKFRTQLCNCGISRRRVPQCLLHGVRIVLWY